MTSSPEHARLLRLATRASVGVASVLIVTKAIAWWLSGSVSMLAGLTDSLLDGVTSLLNLIAVHYALRPADDDHRYGHGKAESLAGMAQALFIAGSAILIALQAFERIKHPEPVGAPWLSIGVIILSLVLTVALLILQHRVVRETGSSAVRADSLHYRSDLLLNAGVLLALVLAGQGWYWADGLFAILIGLFLVWGAAHIGYESVQALLDRQLPEEEQARIMALCCAVEGVHGVHDLRTRQSGPTRFVQLHLELDDQLPLVQAHQIADEAELAVRQSFERMEVIIHMDPISVLTKEQQGTHPEQQ